MNPRQIVASYFLGQAIGTAAWWVLLVAYPPSVKWFQPNDWPAESLLSFWLADFALIVFGSGVAATGVWRSRDRASNAVWAVAVVVWYPTLVYIAASIQTGESWIASAMMVSMAGLSLSMATIHGNADQSPASIRVAAMRRWPAVLWTLGQTVIFWGVFLWVLPMGIVELQHVMDEATSPITQDSWLRPLQFLVTGFKHAFQSSLSIGLFVAASCLGLWSGVTMATRGDGTPLPTATAPRLVIAGPYRFVRNPMAVAGIMQGIAVGWYLGSYAVIVYSLVGAVLWHVAVRPVEERDLGERFGDDYFNYCKSTRLWLPQFRLSNRG